MRPTPETWTQKRDIFQLDEITKPGAILASNTSSLSIGALAEGLSHPERGYWNAFFQSSATNFTTLLEIVRHDKNDQHTIDTIQKIGSMIGKTTILVNDVPGFATSRLGVVLGNEAYSYAAEGVASASDIDTAMRLGYKHPMGPRIVRHGWTGRWRDILNGLSESLGRPESISHLLEKLVKEGSLGKRLGSEFIIGMTVKRLIERILGAMILDFSGLRVLVTGGAGDRNRDMS